jgi:glutamate dehydrogenase
MLARNQQVRCGVQVVKEPKGRRQAINRLMAQLFATHRAIVTSIVTGEGGLAAWRSRNGERLATVTQTIETILASKPFDIARFAVAQGSLADLSVT